MLSATLQAGDLIDQVDRERGSNRNQSRGVQLIHAKRLTHPNTRYTLLVMDSCQKTERVCSSNVHTLFQLQNLINLWGQTVIQVRLLSDCRHCPAHALYEGIILKQ